MNLDLERMLQHVQKPARYVGGEFGQITKDRGTVGIRVAYCFPDTYEIGMSNLGLRIMYGVINGIDGVWCERVFTPWDDMEAQMRANGVRLYALESGDEIREFDVIAFSIGYELSCTNMLNMLDLAGLPIRASERAEDSPLVIAGGVCCFNPEPYSDFVDLFVIGEGEDVACELIDAIKSAKRDRMGKQELLQSAAAIAGVYVPSLFEIGYNDDGTISTVRQSSGGKTLKNGELAISKQADLLGGGTEEILSGVSLPVSKRIVSQLDEAYFPVNGIVPSTGLIHDRAMLEIFRGCIRGCRFCQAGHVTRPVRSRSPGKLIKQGIDSLRLSGYDELALLSLSTSDYAQLCELCDGLMDWCEPRRANLSLPSLRADNFSIELMERLQKVRKSGLTFAPEAGSQRLRDVINKNVTEDELLNTCRIAFEGGWSTIKLYFMLGLPTETDEDVVAIAKLSEAVLQTWKQYAKNKKKGARITVSTSCFIPKPHTPFQWEPQITIDEYLRRVGLLKNSLKSKSITYNWHSPEQGLIEAAIARGDRRLGKVIEAAWRHGSRLDSWSEHFYIENWRNAFDECGLDVGFYALRERTRDEMLPWGVISSGVSDAHLWREREASRKDEKTSCCSENCFDCGIGRLYGKCPGKRKDECNGSQDIGLKSNEGAGFCASEPDIGKSARQVTQSGRTGGQVAAFMPNAGAAASGGYKLRLRFSKTGRAKYISHLDLMATMKRALLRSGIRLKYSQGFNPHPYMSVALPLSVGCSSICELIDIGVEHDLLPEGLAQMINAEMPEGLEILDVYAPLRKFGGIAWVEVKMTMHYINKPQNIAEKLSMRYQQDSILVQKKSKSGISTINIAPYIRNLCYNEDINLTMTARLSAQNPTVTPMNLLSALDGDYAGLAPDFAVFQRTEVYDAAMGVFR